MPISEDIITGKKYRVWSVLANRWKRYSFWSKASDVELNDGTTVESTIDTLKGRFYSTWAEAEADIANIPDGAIVYTDDEDDDNINARNVKFDDGTSGGSDVDTQINQIKSKSLCKINTSSRITFSLSNLTYTATQDMWVIVYGYRTDNSSAGAAVYIDNDVITTTLSTTPLPLFIPLLKNQTLKFNSHVAYNALFGYNMG